MNVLSVINVLILKLTIYTFIRFFPKQENTPYIYIKALAQLLH